jgi:dynein heavy chain, axonemal
MGGAPAGPAGTGKTETTKDLGRSLGFMVYVFNCSEQMDYKSCGNIYKGLAQTGAWGCFDEFNRISVEVLSVVAVQVKTIQDAIRDKKKRFVFMGEEISLNPIVGLFITMNPGYAGRTELPENLKALFRPCAMVVPDFELISEIMLVAEGFTEARLLARKFITLYTLCRELLSKQDHYDWGLRAIKSVLVVAGSLRRGDRERPEDQVLIRALRDFNTPKIVTDDLPIFMGLIGDLFPALDVPRKRDLEFEKMVKQAALDMKLQPEDGFVLKVVQLQELFEVRHSVFIVGNAGTGKSQIWKGLSKTYYNQKKKPTHVDLNPKAVTNDELFGIINPTTREWKDGLFSVIMRDLSNLTSDGPKWIVLDGDIDPMWIESLNTVMDDNKILTLASNERITLTPTMRLLFEISHLRTATPATVSRAGILYINPGDLGWSPQVTSWIDTREVQAERANLQILFDKYVPLCMEGIKSRFKKITPIVENAHCYMLCNLLECMLTPANTPVDCPKDLYELYFVFCCVWAFGSALFQDQITDHRLEFSKWWVTEFKTIKYPATGTVFDYYIDPETKKFEPWTKLVPQFQFDPDLPLQSALVNTSETTRIRYFMDLLVEKGRPVMLVGAAGSGKTVLINDKLASLSEESWVKVNVPFNFYTTSMMLQEILEKPLEKKAGRNYGPPGAKRLVYFIDDMNMPEVDNYGTVQPHTLLRQHMDYKHWYDRQKLTLKEINNCQYISCMNPTAGSFTINPRLQRHFSVFAVSFPGNEAVQTIYNSILTQFLSNGYPAGVQKFSMNLVNCAIAMHARMTASFLPTAIKFHYIFNLRDLSNIFQGILFVKPESLKSVMDLVRLYLHEAERVYCDKLVDKEDFDLFFKIQRDVVKKSLEDVNEEEAFKKPNLYCHFAQGVGDPKYSPVEGWAQLNKILVDALDNYNELNAAMNLVLFEDAMMHICRINRIFESPRGNALLIGVGGSGKQSLSRLAASISSLEVFQVQLRKGYSIADLKLDISNLYIKAGQKGVGVVFLMTDSQVADEKFLVLINDLLASGEIPGLFADEQIDELINNIRNEVKSVGIDDTRENCWRYFIDKVRRLLKVCLCFSPVGSTLRVRSRKFPAVINCTSINWFHEWPEEALKSVAQRFLADVDLLSPELQESVSQFMANVHRSVNEMSVTYLQNDKRYNYTTPKSYLEQISLYKRLLTLKYKELQEKIVRLENGLVKLQSTSKQVDDLKDKLAAQEVEVKQKNEDADKLIKIVSAESEKVGKEKAIADEEQAKVSVISAEVGKKAEDCERDLSKALPALEAAQKALDTLDKNSLTEMKSFANPPSGVLLVSSAVMCLMAPGGKVPKDKSWKAAKAMMGNVDKFLTDLKTYDKDNIHENCRKEVKPFLNDPSFTPELIKTQSLAASGLCSWVVNILKYYEVYTDVAPKRMALNKANAELQAARDKLASVEKKVSELQAQLKVLTDQFDEAAGAKLKCEQDAAATAYTINLANRLVGGLSSENVRWSESVKNFKAEEKSLPGNVLLITAFISYVGCFTKTYRLQLMEFWLTSLKTLKV